VTTLGTHNLLDHVGTPTAFADVILFTEAIPARVIAALGDDFDVHVCRRQKDLVVATRKGLFAKRLERYFPAGPGVRKVTPHRGTYELVGRMNDQTVAIIVEHRINAAFAPFRRGEGWFRSAMWKFHTGITLSRVRYHKRKGRLVLAGGDLNTPRGVSGYKGTLHEVGASGGHGYDRLGSNGPLLNVEVLSRMGSDHPRIKATIGDA
jgi:hypothetical protein